MKKIFIAVLGSTLLFNACSLEEQRSKNTEIIDTLHVQIGPEIAMGVRPLLHQQVCMVNNRFMGKDQIPVIANNKIYYGCCEGCVEALEKDDTYRFDFDPITGQKVDKATAVIIRKPDTSDGVVYFGSENSAKKYIEVTAKK